jgi:hypothetical protein
MNSGQHHLWDDAELAFAGYAHFFWRTHVAVALNTDSASSADDLLKLLGLLRPWYQSMTTGIRLKSPWIMINGAVLQRALAPDDSSGPWGPNRLDVEP